MGKPDGLIYIAVKKVYWEWVFQLLASRQLGAEKNENPITLRIVSLLEDGYSACAFFS